MKWWCDKDLYMDDGQLAFKKDHQYIVKSDNKFSRSATIVDEQGCDHIVTFESWYNNFSGLRGTLRNL